jgi:hypothetical protein
MVRVTDPYDVAMAWQHRASQPVILVQSPPAGRVTVRAVPRSEWGREGGIKFQRRGQEIDVASMSKQYDTIMGKVVCSFE